VVSLWGGKRGGRKRAEPASEAEKERQIRTNSEATAGGRGTGFVREKRQQHREGKREKKKGTRKSPKKGVAVAYFITGLDGAASPASERRPRPRKKKKKKKEDGGPSLDGGGRRKELPIVKYRGSSIVKKTWTPAHKEKKLTSQKRVEEKEGGTMQKGNSV